MKLSYISKFSLSVLKKTNYGIFIISMLLVSTLATVSVIEVAFATNFSSNYAIGGGSSSGGQIQCIVAPFGPSFTTSPSNTGNSINGSSSGGQIQCIVAPCGPSSTTSPSNAGNSINGSSSGGQIQCIVAPC